MRPGGLLLGQGAGGQAEGTMLGTTGCFHSGSLLGNLSHAWGGGGGGTLQGLGNKSFLTPLTKFHPLRGRGGRSRRGHRGVRRRLRPTGAAVQHSPGTPRVATSMLRQLNQLS